jgi:glycosyltransferase involved in cell wall biosynthesis
LWRKGIDLTLQAYRIAFGPSDDVVLTIHFVYGDDEVKNFVEDFIRKHEGELAKVNVIKRALSDQERTLLYEEADLLLHLSRSEGFGLSILEAMSLGTPVMVPDVEPMSDFVSPANGFLIPAHKTSCDKFPCLRGGERVFSQDLLVVEELSWKEIDVTFTSRIMRDIFADRSLIEVRRQAARETACSAWSWDLARNLVSQRITSLGAPDLSREWRA